MFRDEVERCDSCGSTFTLRLCIVSDGGHPEEYGDRITATLCFTCRQDFPHEVIGE